ncbi:MAG: hypothetical protein ACRCZF_13340 [Gemmataceae bacterium]
MRPSLASRSSVELLLRMALWNRLWVLLKDGQLRIELNSSELLFVNLNDHRGKNPMIPDAIFEPGSIGILAHHGSLQFRRFEIRPNP